MAVPSERRHICTFCATCVQLLRTEKWAAELQLTWIWLHFLQLWWTKVSLAIGISVVGGERGWESVFKLNLSLVCSSIRDSQRYFKSESHLLAKYYRALPSFLFQLCAHSWSFRQSKHCCLLQAINQAVSCSFQLHMNQYSLFYSFLSNAVYFRVGGQCQQLYPPLSQLFRINNQIMKSHRKWLWHRESCSHVHEWSRKPLATALEIHFRSLDQKRMANYPLETNKHQ